MARKARRLISRGSRIWLVCISLGCGPEVGTDLGEATHSFNCEAHRATIYTNVDRANRCHIDSGTRQTKSSHRRPTGADEAPRSSAKESGRRRSCCESFTSEEEAPQVFSRPTRSRCRKNAPKVGL